MKQVRIALFFVAFVALLFFVPKVVFAQYGGDTFGECVYGSRCPEQVTPPPPGVEVPDEDEDEDTVSSDVDNDGNDETATDTDGDASNGYEEYNDSDGSSTVLAEIVNDDDDEGTSFIIDTNDDGEPEIYWDPDDEYVTDVVISENENVVCWNYVNSNGQERSYCFENPVQPPTQGGVNSPAPTTGAVEGARRLTGESFGGEAYEKIGEFVQKLPKPIAYGLPYMLISLVGILVIRLALQTRKELTRISSVVGKVRQERALLEEKQNFLMLSSHYMRTPITVMKGNIELLQSLKAINEQMVAALQTSVSTLQEKINTMLSQLSKNSGLETIQPPLRESQAKLRLLLSPPILIPVLSIIVISIFMQFVLIDFRVTRPSVIDVIVQSAIVLLLVQILVSKYRGYKIHKDNRKDQQDILDKQRELDSSRAAFVDTAAATLGQDIHSFDTQLKQLGSQGVDVSKVRKGSDQLKSVVNKFVFAGKLQAGAIQAEKEQFSSKELVDSVVASQLAKAADKHVTIQANGENIMPVQNKQLAGIVLGSLVENAVKYATENSAVTVTTDTNNDSFVLSVENQGEPIADEKINALFKPFARIESAETFDQEGLGFSLYLDRLITMYMGGEVKLRPIPGGTHAELTIPVLG